MVPLAILLALVPLTAVALNDESAMMQTKAQAGEASLQRSESSQPKSGWTPETEVPLQTGPAWVEPTDIYFIESSKATACGADNLGFELQVEIAGVNVTGRLVGLPLANISAMSIISGCNPTLLEPNQAMTFDDKIEFDGTIQLTDLSPGLDRLDQISPPNDKKFRMPNFETGQSDLVNVQDEKAEGKGVHIFVLGSGINPGAGEYSGRANREAAWDGVTCGSCFTSNNSQCGQDYHGSGTMMASLTAGARFGVAMESWIHGVKVTGATSSSDAASSYLAVASCIDYIIASPVSPKVIYVTVSGHGRSAAVKAAIDKAYAADIPVIVPAGNNGNDADHNDACDYTPAYIPTAFAVGATFPVPVEGSEEGKGDKADQRVPSSNIGTCLNMFAPGNAVTAWYGRVNPTAPYELGVASGTASSAAYAAGAVAMLKALIPTLDAESLYFYVQMPPSQKMGIPDPVSGAGEGSPTSMLYLGMGAIGRPTIKGIPPSRRRRSWTGGSIGARSFDPNATDTIIDAKKGSLASLPTSCFPGQSLVQVRGSGATPIADLRSGDFVLDASGAYEPVLGFLHVLEAGKPAEFLTITHTDGEFRASANHLVFVNSREDKAAAELQVGDKLVSTTVPRTVLSVRRSSGFEGMYAPLTASGRVVVDDVVASNYAAPAAGSRLPHSAAHALLMPVRMYQKLGFEIRSAGEFHPFLQTVYQGMGLGMLHTALISA